MKNRATLAKLAATGLGAGYLPAAPGTWGSLEAVALVWAVDRLFPVRAWTLLGALFLLFFFGGVVASAAVARSENDSDPSIVVIDEIAGQILSLMWVPASGAGLLAGFLLFRVFDIIKPSPARRSESLPGGWGIMVDDLIAGIYSGAVLYFLHWFGVL